MSIQKLKAYLANKSEKELTREITDLYQQFSGVKDFYNLQMSAEGANDILAKHKTIIKDQFLPKRGFGDARLSVARKSVMDFKKSVGVHENLVDLALYYVEVGVQYTNTYGSLLSQGCILFTFSITVVPFIAEIVQGRRLPSM